MIQSNLYCLKWRDAAKGLFVAIGTAIVAAVMDSANSGELPSMKLILISSCSGMCAYILKNWLTNSEGKILVKDPIKKLQ